MPRGWLWLVVLLMVLLAAPAGGANSPLEEAGASNQEAVKLYQAGRNQEALPLAYRALEIYEKVLGPEHPVTAANLNNLAMIYKALGAYDKALPLYQRALQIIEKARGPEHPDTATLVNNLAELYRAMGANEQALPLFQRALQIREKTLGPEHPATAGSLNILAGFYVDMGTYDQALPLCQRALQIREKVLGPEHPDTITSLNNLAYLHKVMGAYAQALPLYLKALQISEKTHGPEHPETGTSLNNLAMLYKAMGAYQQALPLFQRSLQVVEKSRGPEHSFTGQSLYNLASLYQTLADYEQALPLYLKALMVLEKVHGPEHPVTATSLGQLAGFYQAMGAYEKALPLYQRALKIREKAQGPEHPDTGDSLSDLAGIYEAMGAYEKALPLYQRALQIEEKTLGPEHPSTASSLSDLAGLYFALASNKQALPLYQRALEIREKALGPEHPSTGSSLSRLASLYEDEGAKEKALPLYQRALTIREKALGPEHPSTAGSLDSLADFYKDMGLYEQALPLYQRALKIREKALGPEHPSTATSLASLASLSFALGAYEEALPLYQRALKIREKALGPEHPSTAESLYNLASLFTLMGAYEEALPLFQRALTIREKVLGPEHPSTASNLSNMGALYLARKDYPTAEVYLRRGKSQEGLAYLFLARKQPEEALKLVKDLAPTWRSTPNNRVSYQTLLGLSLSGLGRFREASLPLYRAVQGVEDLRRRVSGEKAGFFQGGIWGGFIQSYRGLVSVLAEMALKPEALPPDLKEYGPEAGAAAFYFAESTKSRVLLETLAAAARQETRVEIPAELRQREEGLLNRLAALEAQWEKAFKGGEGTVKEVQEEKTRCNGELQALIKELRHNYPLYAALHYPEPIPAADLPLKENEVLLEYALGEAASYLMVVRRGGVQKVVRIPLGREELEGKVKAFMEPFINTQIDGFSLSQAKQLYDLLLAGVLPEIKETDRVIIVPDGILGLLPFEALVLKQGQGLSDSVFVGDKYPLTYYQSAAVLALKRRLKEEPAGRLLFALGNPVFSEQDQRYRTARPGGKPASGNVRGPAAAAFTALATSEAWGKTTRGSAQGQELVYPPLKETEGEVRAIAGLLGVKPSPPDVLLNLQANETFLKKSPLQDYRYLHFATHADLPGKVQGIKEPFILLGQVGNQAGDNGFFTLSKVLGLKLKAQMVVLSACVTGRGKVMEGEGVANFARAFQHAGAQSVVVSLWEVASNETVEYMTRFYEHLKDGKSRLEALQLARRAIKAKYPQPFFWAVFILHGEG
jgi:tetratricopeptide (TPR) repeat protein